jgi:hypothetical protein
MTNAIRDMHPFFKCLFVIGLLFAVTAGSIIGLEYSLYKWPMSHEERQDIWQRCTAACGGKP